MRKLLSLVLSIVLILSLAAPAFAATVKQEVSAAAVSAGEEVTVTVTLDETMTDITMYQYSLYYNKALFELTSTDGSAATISNPLSDEDGDYYMISYVDTTSEGQTIAAGTIAVLKFKAMEDMTAEQAASFKLEKDYVWDTTFDDTGDGTVENGEVFVTVSPAVTATGYTVTASGDVSTTVGSSAAVSVSVTGNANSSVTGYNDYDVTVSYDPAELTYVSAEAADTGATITNDAAAGTIRITGHGAAKDYSVAVVTLNFTAQVAGESDVTITSAKIDNSGNAIAADAPEAKIDDKTTTVKVVYSVSLPEGFKGNVTVLPNGDYTFTAPNEYYDITITVGGVVVEPVVDGLTYMLFGINGNIVVTAVGKTYNVTKTAENAVIGGADTAQYGVDYTFTVTPNSGYAVTEVSVNEKAINYSYDAETGVYTIAGTDITGDIEIVAKAAEQEENTTQITFSGVQESEIVGGLIQFAPNGQDFRFQLNEEDGFVYTVRIGDTELTPDENGVYTIPGDLINGGALIVTIEKTATLTASVYEYITLDEQTMFLVTATNGDKVLSYNGKTMFWSEKYSAYSWLVISGHTVDTVKEEALSAITVAAEGTTAAAIAYDCDVNQTTVVDINDAQLTYDMYTAVYDSFDKVTMDKFLEADLNGDGKVYTEDAAAIVSKVVAQ